MSTRNEDDYNFQVEDLDDDTPTPTSIDEVLDKHYPVSETSASAAEKNVTHIMKINQEGINHNDDLKLAAFVLQQGHGNNREPQTSSGLAIDSESDGFNYNTEGLTSAIASHLLQQYGLNELPKPRSESKLCIFVRQLFGPSPMPIMIWIAIIVLLIINNTLDAFILFVVQFTNASISYYEIVKATDAIAVLQSTLQPTATVKRDNVWQAGVSASLLVPGDTILLAAGSNVPADCRINPSSTTSKTNFIDVDQSSLTGESLPISLYKGDSCKMGSTVVRGEVEATVEFTGTKTFFGRTAKLVQGNTNERSHLQHMLITIMFVLVGISSTLCTINFLYLLLQGEDVKESLSFTIVLLVASIPLAMEIVTTTTLAIGSKTLAKHGAIVTKLSAIEELAGMSILCSDKTGTLTINKMVLLEEDETPVYSRNETAASVLLHAALASKWNEPPRDAVDRLVLGAYDADSSDNTIRIANRADLQNYEQMEYVPFDPTIKRTESSIRRKDTGEQYQVTKGAPHIILDLLPNKSSDMTRKMRQQVETDVAKYGERGIRTLAVARTIPTQNNDWHVIGLLTFLDPPRPDTKSTIQETRKHGVQVKMITGDHVLIARNTALQLEMGDKIFTAERLPLLDPDTQSKPENLSQEYGDLCVVADGFAQVYPEHKYLIVECLRELGYTVGMTGDGVNDAPALKRADIGIAVAGATDAARAASDIVLTEPGLSTIAQGIILSRHIFQRMSNFITYRISATLQLLLFFFLSCLFMHPGVDYTLPDNLDRGEPWPEFFHLPIIMLMLITVLNDGTLITIAYDNTEASQTPNRWNIRALFVVSSVLGGVSCISSLMLLHYLLDSWNPDGLLQSARTGPRFFWRVTPAPILFMGGCAALTVSSLLAIFWPDSEPDGILTEGLLNEMELFIFVWVFCLFFWIVQDVAKVITYMLLYRFNYANIRGNGVVQYSESARQLIAELEEASERGGSTRQSSSIV